MLAVDWPLFADVLGANKHTSIAMPPRSADHKINQE